MECKVNPNQVMKSKKPSVTLHAIMYQGFTPMMYQAFTPMMYHPFRHCAIDVCKQVVI